jgi:hypothetical protein
MPWGRPKYAKGDDDIPPPKLITLFGLDLYLVGFIAVGGGFILLGIFWLFFTRLPIPVYCFGYTSRWVRVCGSASREPAPVDQHAPTKPPERSRAIAAS